MDTEIPRILMRRYAREQRAKAVQAETIMWRALRDRRCEGAKFQRQVPLGKYIVDFVCFESRLIVEIDGPTHDSAVARATDASRDAWLDSQGFRILRLSNELVIASSELAVAKIREAIALPRDPPHPSSLTR